MALSDLLRADGFRTGLLLGLLGAAALAMVRASQRRIVPWAGVALVAAALLALGSDLVPNPLVLALVLVAGGGYLTRDADRVIQVIAALPSAIVVAADLDAGRIDWIPVAALLAISLGAALVADFDRVATPTGLALVLVAVTAIGIYFCGPETQWSTVLTGAALPIALLGWPVPMASLGWPGAYATATLVAWVAVVSGGARPGAVVGGLACLGILVIEPAVAWAGGRHALAAGRALIPRVIAIAAIHGVVVVVCSRVAGLRESASSALGIVALTFLGAALATLALGFVAGAQSRRG